VKSVLKALLRGSSRSCRGCSCVRIGLFQSLSVFDGLAMLCGSSLMLCCAHTEESMLGLNRKLGRSKLRLYDSISNWDVGVFELVYCASLLFCVCLAQFCECCGEGCQLILCGMMGNSCLARIRRFGRSVSR
jgi:hypothetical protein